jgi:hypothetical protein
MLTKDGNKRTNYKDAHGGRVTQSGHRLQSNGAINVMKTLEGGKEK